MLLAEKVDRGKHLSVFIKKMEKELDAIKKDLKAHAKKHDLQEIAGKKAVAKFSPSGWTSIQPKALFTKLQELKQKDLFFGLVKVQIVAAKKALGEVVFDSISESGSTPFNKVTFKDL